MFDDLNALKTLQGLRVMSIVLFVFYLSSKLPVIKVDETSTTVLTSFTKFSQSLSF